MNSDYINAILVNGFNEKLKLILKDICDKNAELRYDVLWGNGNIGLNLYYSTLEVISACK